jgi:hypothetical protein
VNPHGAEILIDEPMSKRGRRMLIAMLETAPKGTVASSKYKGSHRLLMMYGAGLEVRRQALEAHKAAGGTVAVWDLGYWDRDDSMRLSLGALHPTAEQLALAPKGCRREHVLREDADPKGPILLIGLGVKSGRLYGLQTMEWEQGQMQRLRDRGRQILWRPKGRQSPKLHGATLRHGMPIEEALKGCSLVVCRHSNVAVDACIAGVPVECEDGAAFSLYRNGTTPSREDRAEFLRRLGWWNWRPTEAAQAWDWIRSIA